VISESSQQLYSRGFLTGKLLIAMPYLPDPRFNQSVIYVCGHDETGAMGLVVNKPLYTVTFKELIEQMNLPAHNDMPDFPIHYGGPVEIGRGFVLHTIDYLTETSVIINGEFALTATLEVLRAMSSGRGPKNTILALGYVGWDEQQLEKEIQENGWIVIEPTPELVFSDDFDDMWRSAMLSIGVDPNNITLDAGHA
jgi:putative transcriptional regulator